MWAGDYHININMQMQYWAADTSAIFETLPPLFDFVARMASAGHNTATSMYGCGKKQGWVAHGFFDGFMHTGIASEYFWALCVTW